MFTKSKKNSMVLILPANSLTNTKEEMLDNFAEITNRPLAVFNRSFGDLEIVDESTITRKDRLSICNGVVCDSSKELGISSSIDKLVNVKEIDISSVDENGNSTRSKIISGVFKVVEYCGYGEPIFDRVGNIIAEISPDKNIFFLFDVLSENVNDNILEYILDEAGLYLFNKSITGRTESYSNASFLYKNIASKKIDQKINAIKDTVDKTKEKIERMENKLVLLIRLKDKAQIIMNSEYTLRDTIAEKVKSDLNDMSKIEGYQTIRFLNDKIFGITKEIIITHGSKKFKLGKYRIEIGFDTSNVRIFNVGANLHKGNSNTQHPHVMNNQACLGNISGTLHQYVAKYEFSVVFDLLYQLLTNYNPDSPYSDIGNWPTV